eukprot:13453252-Ditylum_brightwellii.AAC.1
MHLKTIEHVKVSVRSDHQKYEKCSDVFKHEDHYVDISKVRGKKTNSVVSDWFFDHVNSKVVKNIQNNYVQTITPIMEDQVLKFQAILGNDAKEMVSHE